MVLGEILELNPLSRKRGRARVRVVQKISK
jgi:hypothetical protein